MPLSLPALGLNFKEANQTWSQNSPQGAAVMRLLSRPLRLTRTSRPPGLSSAPYFVAIGNQRWRDLRRGTGGRHSGRARSPSSQRDLAPSPSLGSPGTLGSPCFLNL